MMTSWCGSRRKNKRGVVNCGREGKEMATCMRCNTEITADNYDMNWTLMCNSCHSRYSAKDTVSPKVLAEREACAKIADDAGRKFYRKDMREAAKSIADEIRARSKEGRDE